MGNRRHSRSQRRRGYGDLVRCTVSGVHMDNSDNEEGRGKMKATQKMMGKEGTEEAETGKTQLRTRRVLKDLGFAPKI